MRTLSENVRCFGNRYFNLFLVGKNRSALIECAVSGAVANLSRQWKPALPEVEYLVAMHAHFDHVCGIPALKQLFPNAVVASSAASKKVLSKSHIIKDFFSQDMSMARLLAEEGLLNEPIIIPAVEHINVDYVIQNGDIIGLTSYANLKIIAAPGHSPDSLAAYLPSDQVLFISDAAGFQISDQEIFPVFFQSYPIYMETLKELRSYPTRVLALPHGSIHKGSEIESFYRRSQHAAEELFCLVRDLSEKGIDNQTIQDTLYRQYYKGDLRIYTPANISTCIELLVRRIQQCL